MSLVACIPNFSEGQRHEVIATIRQAIEVALGTPVLDVSSDADHNRSVITFVGAPEAVISAAFAGAAEAARQIDLRQHSGVHPRIGAVDVIPLVPLRDISLSACADLARGLGKRIGEALDLPVYLYEAAAQREDRRNLANVRRDPYERLRQTITTDPDRQPDFGPVRLGPAGAVAVGARGPLIAFNAYLDTDDVQIAREIARRVRESSGGLPQLKALGLLVAGRAQVSMNIVNFRETGLFAALAAVERQAASFGVQVVETELVGLAPLRALLDAALVALKLPSASRDLILETQAGRMTGDYREFSFE